ncbi:MAG: Cof-type HAD-IIB family hydrolase [Firmicutes bacterium]|nr:Cof-type HAD-IIB family hydrolase [Bacillota bacterium]
MIKAIILDIDGVIVGEKVGYNSPEPHPDVMVRMNQIKDSGVKIILCTAKPHFAIRNIIGGANLANPHITDGGGVLIDPITNKIVKKYALSDADARKVLKMCLDNDIYVEAYTEDEYVIQRSQVCDITDQHTHILQTEPLIVDDLLAFRGEITKIMPVVNGEEEKAKFAELFNSLGTDLTLNWGIHPIALPLLFGIITAKGISKKQGMLDILDSLGISSENALGVGDSNSDWQYMELCGSTATMANASDELKSKAAFTGGHVDENGVLDIFDSFFGEG